MLDDFHYAHTEGLLKKKVQEERKKANAPG